MEILVLKTVLVVNLITKALKPATVASLIAFPAQMAQLALPARVTLIT